MMEIFAFVVLAQCHNLAVNLHLRLRMMSLPRPNAGADPAHAGIFARDRRGLSRYARWLRVLGHAPGNVRFQYPIC